MIRTLVRAALASLVLLHTMSALARAQQPPSSIAQGLGRGEPVRAYAPAVKKGPCKGRFEAVRADSLLILSRGRRCALPLYAVEQVDRRTDRESDSEALLRGGLWGGGSLAGIIYLIGCGTGECFRDGMSMGIVNMAAGMVAIPGAIIGSLVAVASPKEKWENVWRADTIPGEVGAQHGPTGSNGPR